MKEVKSEGRKEGGRERRKKGGKGKRKQKKEKEIEWKKKRKEGSNITETVNFAGWSL